ncbi:MAG: hypothetical protein EZS28_035754 [Streblomastix strix]|uniref:Uncharacterized protein n=1 Tax=Streblomastix strix TaxID=222440 RepID=A0A5J4UDM7_9EUKA|nr:MAG: hypothetical protein EZS28_035754 [Streblomastix strix]
MGIFKLGQSKMLLVDIGACAIILLQEDSDGIANDVLLKMRSRVSDANDGVMNVRVSWNVTQDSIAEGKERAIIQKINKG